MKILNLQMATLASSQYPFYYGPPNNIPKVSRKRAIENLQFTRI